MNPILLAGIMGGFGGAVRATVGLSKALHKKRKIKWDYWLTTTAIAVVIGIFAGMILNLDYKMSILAGYAGTDLLEGLFKTISGRGFDIRCKF